MDAEIQAICEDVVQAWRRRHYEDAHLKEYLSNVLDQVLPSLVQKMLVEKHPEIVARVADSVVKKWIEEGEVALPPPTPSQKRIIDGLMHDMHLSVATAKGFISRNKVVAYRMAQAGVDEKQIAREMKLTPRVVSSLLKAAAEDIQQAQEVLSAYEKLRGEP